MKKLLAGIAVFAVLLMLALTYITARFVDQEEIMRAKLERAQMQATRDSLYTLVAVKDSLQRTLLENVENLQDQTSSLLEQVSRLEEERQAEQLSVRNIRKTAELKRRFEETFPEVAGSEWGTIELASEEGFSLEYLAVPAWFTETFIIDHKNADSWRQQKDKLMEVDSLRTRVIALQDTVFRLEKEKSAAWKAGFDVAFARYDTLSQKYISLLEKPPQVKFGIPNLAVAAVGAAVGVATGVLITR